MAVLDPSDVKAVAVEENVVFGHGSGQDLLCDIYRPSAQTTRRTAVIHLHGGGFRAGTKAGARLARPLAALGYSAGGYLALVTSAQPELKVAPCVAFYAPAQMGSGHPLGGPNPRVYPSTEPAPRPA